MKIEIILGGANETKFTQQEIMKYSLGLKKAFIDSANEYLSNLEKDPIFSTWDLMQIFSTAASGACYELYTLLLEEINKLEKEIVE